MGDELKIGIGGLDKEMTLEVVNKGLRIPVVHDLSPREIETIKAGGTLNYTKNQM